MSRRERHSERRPGRSCRHKAQRGFTILELLIAMSIAALLVGVMAVGVKRVRKSDLRADTASVAAALRTAYNLATQTGKHHRVMIDLDEQNYQVQTCEGKVKLQRETTEQEYDPGEDEAAKEELQRKLNQQSFGQVQTSEMLADVQNAESPAEAAEKALALTGRRIGAARCGPATTLGGDVSKRGEVQYSKKNQGVKISRVHVQHLEDPVEEGKVAINFFPMGYAEKAVVELRAGDDPRSRDDLYILLVHGLTGRVEFKDGEWRRPDEHMMRDGAGRDVEDGR